MINAVVETYAQRINILFIQNTLKFLEDNQLFWNNVGEALLDMNKMSLELKAKIEATK